MDDGEGGQERTDAVGAWCRSLGLDLVGQRLPRPVSLFIHCWLVSLFIVGIFTVNLRKYASRFWGGARQIRVTGGDHREYLCRN
jgi:hypothetical protein